MTAFNSGAAFYAAFSDKPARLNREGPFLLRLLNAAPGHRVADLACGTGLHAAFLAEHGALVDAFDLSPDMIAEAQKRHPHMNVRYQQSDMRTTQGGPWDLMYCIGNSLCLLPTAEGLRETFTRASACLAENGVFFVHVLNYQASAAGEPRHRVETMNLQGTRITAVKSLVPSDGETLLSLAYFATSNGATTSVAETAVLRHTDSDELSAIAQNAGLTPDHIWGGYDGRRLDIETAPDLLMTFRK